MARNAQGRMAITKIILNPRVEYAGSGPDRATEKQLHHLAHELRYIANSVTTEVETSPVRNKLREIHAPSDELTTDCTARLPIPIFTGTPANGLHCASSSAGA
jgi:hypothetical protein